MTIYINDNPIEVADSTSLASALDAASIATTQIATALNGNVIPRDKRAETTLKEGDRILIIKAFYGG